ncbi:MAG: hypothetical protein IKH11_06570 [Bacteroidales bacterium]|nr:hypothetical protein [Bacteroidales bacterium]
MDKNFLNKLSGIAGALGIKLDKIKAAVPGAGNKTKSFTFQAVPRSLAELQALPEAALTDVYATAALTVLALAGYEQDREASLAMLDWLKGPDSLSVAERQHIADRFMDGKYYKVRSFFDGATPANNYTPSTPLRIQVSSNPYSFDNENWATLYLSSGGADNPRPVRLRKKPSTGQWFLVEIQFLGDIRTPIAQDKWA